MSATIQNWHNCEKKISMLFYVRIKKGLVHAMHCNGPLHQVTYIDAQIGHFAHLWESRLNDIHSGIGYQNPGQNGHVEEV